MKISDKHRLDEDIVIYDLSDLYNLQETNKLNFFPSNSNLVFKLGQLTEFENNEWQHKLAKHYLACGCKEGAATSIFFFVIYWFITIFVQGLNSTLKWETWILSFICLFMGAVIGKIIKIIYSRFVFQKYLRELFKLLSQRVIAE